ncbi:MAG: hypothetical protein HGA31_01530 [Candidatus Moranbacteria bacterium]|nr:hypothetical protein [Candidatus Moranbacteria bacterium]
MRTVFFSVLFASGIGVVLMVRIFSDKPATGSVVSHSAPVAVNDAMPIVPIATYAGKHYSIRIPSSYEEKSHDIFNDRGNLLEQAYHTDHSTHGRTIAVTVERLPQNGLEELTGFRYRTINPDTYVRDVVNTSAMRLPVFKKNTPVFELTGFIVSGTLSASISLTSAVDETEKLMADFISVSESFQWVSNETST